MSDGVDVQMIREIAALRDSYKSAHQRAQLAAKPDLTLAEALYCLENATGAVLAALDANMMLDLWIITEPDMAKHVNEWHIRHMLATQPAIPEKLLRLVAVGVQRRGSEGYDTLCRIGLYWVYGLRNYCRLMKGRNSVRHEGAQYALALLRGDARPTCPLPVREALVPMPRDGARRGGRTHGAKGLQDLCFYLDEPEPQGSGR